MYNAFAAYYDRLTVEIDYRQRAHYFDSLIRQNVTVTDQTILMDLGCGTGSMTVALSDLGYDVIGVDGSSDMLSEAVLKQNGRRILYLCQSFESLDLYGTIDVAVCALDSLNHITEVSALEKTFERVSLFTVPGGLFLFDVNTPYKHRKILGNQTFVYDMDDLYCVWQNTTDEQLKTEISLDFFISNGKNYTRESESFSERAWTQETILDILTKTGYNLLSVYEGDTKNPLCETSQRAVYVAQKCARSADSL